MNTYLDTRIIALNSIDAISYRGYYKSNAAFQFNGLLKQEDSIEQIQISLVNAQIQIHYKIY